MFEWYNNFFILEENKIWKKNSDSANVFQTFTKCCGNVAETLNC